MPKQFVDEWPIRRPKKRPMRLISLAERKRTASVMRAALARIQAELAEEVRKRAAQCPTE